MSSHVLITPGAQIPISLFTATASGNVPAGVALRTGITVVIQGGPPLIGYVIPAAYGRVHFGLLAPDGAAATTAEIFAAINLALGPP
jgi:hypothetical protein